MQRDDATIGVVGVLTVATRGDKGAGEVLIKVRGGSECFIAWSDNPLARGTKVLVINHRGSRTVDVIEWEGSLLRRVKKCSVTVFRLQTRPCSFRVVDTA